MKKIGVLGTGTMGAGIVQVLAQNGYEVVMRARHQASIDKGLAKVEKALTKMVSKEKISEGDKTAILGRISGSTELRLIYIHSLYSRSRSYRHKNRSFDNTPICIYFSKSCITIRRLFYQFIF